MIPAMQGAICGARVSDTDVTICIAFPRPVGVCASHIGYWRVIEALSAVGQPVVLSRPGAHV